MGNKAVLLRHAKPILGKQRKRRAENLPNIWRRVWDVRKPPFSDPLPSWNHARWAIGGNKKTW